MRQNSKNNRSRGRGRKNPNPLTRSYESNGPDVKVRGTAQHVADKYMTLARDALSSGDGVAAENYFQHAEHYNRIIMAAQSQQNAAREERAQNANQENDDQPQVNGNDTATQAAPVMTGNEPQPSVVENPAETKEAKADNDADKPAPAASASEGEEPAPKPRRRRAPAKPKKTSAKADEPKQVEGGTDTIAENPPAFLMSE